MAKPVEPPRAEETAPALAVGSAVWLVLVLAAGGAMGLLVLPSWLPAIDQSLRGETPHAPWYICRASGVVAFVLLWVSTCSGLIISARIARDLEMTPAVLDVHQHLALSALAFTLLHAAALAGDTYIGFGAPELVFPFSTRRFKPLPMGLGQVAAYCALLGTLAFYLRRDLGARCWRGLHVAGSVAFLLALWHAVLAGSSAGSPTMRALYWFAGGSTLLLFFYRVLSRRFYGQADGGSAPRAGSSDQRLRSP